MQVAKEPFIQTRHYDVDAFNTVMTPQVEALEASLTVHGELPEHLAGGSYFLNGPAMVHLGGQLMHPFDGHGFLRAVRIGEGSARLQARFVDTPPFRTEKAAGKAKFRGIGSRVGSNVFTNLFAPWGKNTANTCVVPWAGRLLALNEGGLPYALDPATLETRGIETFGGALDGLRTVLAHTKYDAVRNRLVLCSLKPGPKTGFTFIEIDADGQQVARHDAQVDGMVFIHDYAITDSHYVVLENPVGLDVGGLVKMVAGVGSMVKMLRCSDRPARLILVPRGGGPTREIDLGRGLFAVHNANAWEAEGELIIDTACFQSFAFGNEFGYRGPDLPLDPGPRNLGAGQQFTRFTVGLEDGSVQEESLSEWSLDFPRIHPDLDGKPYRYAWTATSTPQGANDPFTALLAVDVQERTSELWSAGQGCFVGEPVFAPRPGGTEENDGHVLAMVYDGRASTCFLGVFEPGAIADGPRARIELPMLLPYGFHGWWGRQSAG